jgi:hypothetical protein
MFFTSRVADGVVGRELFQSVLLEKRDFFSTFSDRFLALDLLLYLTFQYLYTFFRQKF